MANGMLHQITQHPALIGRKYATDSHQHAPIRPERNLRPEIDPLSTPYLLDLFHP